jgi:YVTN family beta-propeller protein
LTRHTKQEIFTIGALALFAFLVALRLPARPSRQSSAEPASEGRPITPAGSLVFDATTQQPAVGSLPIAFVRSPDHAAKDGGGRYLISVNSGYGLQFNAATNQAQQSLSVIDLDAPSAPQVIQNVYFPSPQSAMAGAVFAPTLSGDGVYTLYVSGGNENKIWRFSFTPNQPRPISPSSNGLDTKVTAPFISVAGFSTQAPTPRYNANLEPVYPLGLALSEDGDTLFTANDLGDSLGVIRDLRADRSLARVDLSDGKPGHVVYPYGVAAWAPRNAHATRKVFISCWATAQIAVVDPAHPEKPPSFIPVERHPTAMIFNSPRTRLYVANSDADSVSVIDPESDRVVESISVRLAENSLPGTSPEGLALDADGSILYVANSHSNALAVVSLSAASEGKLASRTEKRAGGDDDKPTAARSAILGFIPTGQYPSAVAVANGYIFVANGKGTGVANSSLEVNDTGRAPNAPNDLFPAGTGATKQGGQYIGSLISGNISRIAEPTPRALADYTAQVMRNDGLTSAADVKLFPGPSPIRHVIYIIRENRSYDQVFGDIAKSGDGTPADGDLALAIFGCGDAARPADNSSECVTPNARALALRFGLLDRFFVNSEASPDGHNWADAAFSSDYVDKAYRWNYSGRGRSYDFRGANRAPDFEPRKGEPPFIPVPATSDEITRALERYVPYLHGARDVAEPETLYLWDDAARSGISYRSNGEGVVTISQAQIEAFNANREREYPDTTATVISFALKKSLEGHVSNTHREFDTYTPDSMTAASYTAAMAPNSHVDPLVSAWNQRDQFRGYSRIAAWLAEFRGYVSAFQKGQSGSFPAFNIVYLPNDHTSGMRPHLPTPQFHVADNDYALGLLVQEVSSSPYWRDTAILVLEDDAQNGPDHIDAHRSPALVISAYNRPGALIHAYHSTVSLIRTLEILLGLPPMNQLDASAAPIDIFQSTPDLTPYRAILPSISLNNLIVTPPPSSDSESALMIRRSLKQNFEAPDLADPDTLDRIIWFSVRGRALFPATGRLPVFDAMRTASASEASDEEQARALAAVKQLLAQRTHR